MKKILLPLVLLLSLACNRSGKPAGSSDPKVDSLLRVMTLDEKIKEAGIYQR